MKHTISKTPIMMWAGLGFLFVPSILTALLSLIHSGPSAPYALLFSQCAHSSLSAAVLSSSALVVNAAAALLLSLLCVTVPITAVFIESILDIFESFPHFIFIIIITALYYFVLYEYSGITSSPAAAVLMLSLIIALSFIPQTVRFLLLFIRSYLTKPFVSSLRTSGIPLSSIVMKNILWNNGRFHIIMYFVLLIRNIIITEAGLSFLFSLGFGGYGSFPYAGFGGLVAQYRKNILFGTDVMYAVLPLAVLVCVLLGIQLLYMAFEQMGEYEHTH